MVARESNNAESITSKPRSACTHLKNGGQDSRSADVEHSFAAGACGGIDLDVVASLFAKGSVIRRPPVALVSAPRQTGFPVSANSRLHAPTGFAAVLAVSTVEIIVQRPVRRSAVYSGCELRRCSIQHSAAGAVHVVYVVPISVSGRPPEFCCELSGFGTICCSRDIGENFRYVGECGASVGQLLT